MSLFYRNININAKNRSIYIKAHDIKSKHIESDHNKYLRRKALNLDYHNHKSFLIREYLICSNICDIVIISPMFNNWILLCIIIAGALVGIQTYSAMENDYYVNIANQVVIYSFLSELVLKLISEGLGPQWYFFGEDWKWNWFDMFIVVFSFDGILPVGGSGVKLLRLFRLARLAKVFRRVTELKMILLGLVGGLKSVFYILILMVLIFYVYGVAAVIFFRDNDPFHFSSIEKSLIVMLQVATLDNWGEVFFINYFGCNGYPSDRYVQIKSLENSSGIKYCASPAVQKELTSIFFISFIFLSSFCMLSLFIGTIMLAMAESLIDMGFVKEQARQQREKEKADLMEKEYMERREKQERKVRRALKLLETAFQGEDVYDYHEEIVLHWTKPENFYKWLSVKAVLITDSQYFQKFYTFVIIVAGVLVGFTTDSSSIEYQKELDIAENVIQYLFLFEIIMKMLTFEFKVWKYFMDGWNVFDFIVVMGAFAPAAGNFILVLRLLRLLRVLKLMRAVKQLQVILYALGKGAYSMLFISIILFLFFYFFAIAGVTFFGDSDPIHFGTLHSALLTLFNMSTFDGWADSLWINAYGCAEAPSYGRGCVKDKSYSQFILASIYWIIFVVLGGLVLLALFIGVVNLSMNDARHEADENVAIDKRALKIAEVEGLSSDKVFLYKEVFSIIDISRSERIGREEMKLGLKIGGLHLERDEFEKLWIKVDKDSSNNISFSEFLEFMITLKSEIAQEEASYKIRGSSKRRFTFVGGMKSTKEYEDGLSVLQNKVNNDVNVNNDDDDESTLDQLLGLGNSNKKTFTKQKVVPFNDQNDKSDDLHIKKADNILDAMLGLGSSSQYDTSFLEEIKTPRGSKVSPFPTQSTDTSPLSAATVQYSIEAQQQKMFVSTPNLMMNSSIEYVQQPEYVMKETSTSPSLAVIPGFTFSSALPHFPSALPHFSSAVVPDSNPFLASGVVAPNPLSDSGVKPQTSRKGLGFPKQ